MSSVFTPDRILHVGDNAETDVKGARSAGYKTAWINRYNDVYPADKPKADIEINSLDDLVAMTPPIHGSNVH